MYKFFIKISFILLLFLFFSNSVILGMGISYLKKGTVLYKKYYKKHLDNKKIGLLDLPDDIFYPIFAGLDNKNAFQLVSKKAQMRGSKRVPNFYSIAKCPGFIASEKDYTYGMINATYDKRVDVINNIEKKTSNKKHEYCLFIHKNLQSMLIRINDKNDPLMMACYSGNLKKVKSLLKDNEANKAFRKRKVLSEAFSIAVGKNDIDCLRLFISERNKEDCLKQTEFIQAQIDLLAVALNMNKKEAFEVVGSAHWQKVDFYPFPAIMFANEDVLKALEGCGRSELTSVCNYREYMIKHFLNVYNAERKNRGWKTSIKLLLKQEEDLNIKIKKPLIEALQKNDIQLLQTLVGKIENKQLFYDNRCCNRLREIHFEVLNEAKRLRNKEGFGVLSRLRLEGETQCFGEYHRKLLKLVKSFD